MNETILYFEDKVLLCKPGWPQTLHPSASSFLRDGTSFVYHHAQLDCFLWRQPHGVNRQQQGCSVPWPSLFLPARVTPRSPGFASSLKDANCPDMVAREMDLVQLTLLLVGYTRGEVNLALLVFGFKEVAGKPQCKWTWKWSLGSLPTFLSVSLPWYRISLSFFSRNFLYPLLSSLQSYIYVGSPSHLHYYMVWIYCWLDCSETHPFCTQIWDENPSLMTYIDSRLITACSPLVGVIKLWTYIG